MTRRMSLMPMLHASTCDVRGRRSAGDLCTCYLASEAYDTALSYQLSNFIENQLMIMKMV